MKNVTIAIDDDTYHAARVEAAKRKTSISAVVRTLLAGFAQGKLPIPETDPLNEERKNREELVSLFREANLVLGYKPTREKTYER